MKIALLPLFVLALAPLHMADDPQRTCPGVPHVSTEVACRSACGTKFMYDLCIDAMRRGGLDPSPSHTEETTVYAMLAGNQTITSYDKTHDAMLAQWRDNASLSGPERDTYCGCMDDYITSSNFLLAIVVMDLPDYLFSSLDKEFREAMNSLENCRDRMLAPWISRPPLLHMVESYRNNVMLAYFLARLLEAVH
ncbi:unnamed protein product [Alopecurus aequalis]